MITLQQGQGTRRPIDYLTLPCRVVRHGIDGVGLSFLVSSNQERRTLKRLVNSVGGAVLVRHAFRSNGGEAVLEFALIIPFVFLLIINAFNFGSFIFCWLAVADAVRAAADYVCTDANTASGPVTPTIAQITSVVQSATSDLPNYSATNPSVNVCQTVNGTTTEFGSSVACGVTAPPSDPEPIALGSSTYYTTAVVDVSYTFTPILAGSTFLRFGLPSLPSTVHRRMVVRWP
jgi:Flp pilus assembly protein TadG